MTTINVNELRALFNEKALSKTEGEKISFSSGALQQMKGYLNAVIEATGYDEGNLTDKDMEIAKKALEMYSPEAITGEVIDGVIQPNDEKTFNAIVGSVPNVAKYIGPSMVLVMGIVAEEAEKKGFFYR